ncbi:MAG: hypothetical protein FWF75_08405 [Propionibacteriaceae bacterium]|nr:hypothetical protein [Propionibacteriaceae bacterium]
MTARTRLIALVAGIAALASCTGCATRMSTAFSVDGTVVTQDQVEQVAQSCLRSYTAVAKPATPMSESTMRAMSVQWQIDGAIGVAMAHRVNATFSQDDLTQFLTQFDDTATFTADPLCKQTIDDFALAGLLSNQLGMEQFLADLSTLDIVVNPRYGQFDPSSLAMTGTGSLSQLDSKH